MSQGASTGFFFSFGGPPVATVQAERAESRDAFREQAQVESGQYIPTELVNIDESLFEKWSIGGVEFARLSSRAINPASLPSDLAAIVSSNDLVPGKYEGGFKLWECTADLVEHMATLSLADKVVCELGCGNGIPGIHALRQGAHVDFQDYNKEVLALLTVPNVAHNGGLQGRARFFYGDWGTLSNHVGADRRYDFIVSAETIYAPAYYSRLTDFVSRHLTADGVALFAAKSYYFGVGGSCSEFLAHVAKCPGLRGERVVRVADGVSTQREIISIRRATA